MRVPENRKPKSEARRKQRVASSLRLDQIGAERQRYNFGL